MKCVKRHSTVECMICRLLKKCGITRKKIRRVALQRCEQLRGSFMAQCFLFRRDMFVVQMPEIMYASMVMHCEVIHLLYTVF